MDQSVIPFAGIASWVLRTPHQRPQSTSQIMGMVAHVALDQYERADAAERPALGFESSVQGALCKPLQNLLALCSGQLGRTPGRKAVGHTAQVALLLLEALRPFADCHPTDGHVAGMSSWESWPARSNRPASNRRSSSCIRVRCAGRQSMGAYCKPN
jgi:hypothetical protein